MRSVVEDETQGSDVGIATFRKEAEEPVLAKETAREWLESRLKARTL